MKYYHISAGNTTGLCEIFCILRRWVPAGEPALCASGGLLSFFGERKQPKNAARNQGFWKSPKRRQWRIKRGGFEEVSRLAATKWTGIGWHDGVYPKRAPHVLDCWGACRAGKVPRRRRDKPIQSPIHRPKYQLTKIVQKTKITHT